LSSDGSHSTTAKPFPFFLVLFCFYFVFGLVLIDNSILNGLVMVVRDGYGVDDFEFFFFVFDIER
jgi:hypothetical protein